MPDLSPAEIDCDSRREKQRAIFSLPDSANLPSKLLSYIETALCRSYEGEVLTLLVAGVYRLLYKGKNALVEVHPVNQCGASSHEISDLDIYVDGVLVSSNELKDKDYTEPDVRHAADKVLQSEVIRCCSLKAPGVQQMEILRQQLNMSIATETLCST